MLGLALMGVVLRLPVVYSLILTPVFGVISISECWSHFANRPELLGLMWRLALDLCGVLLSIYCCTTAAYRGC
jgi:hypothetical protein